jgi:hypothetical protein
MVLDFVLEMLLSLLLATVDLMLFFLNALLTRVSGLATLPALMFLHIFISQENG